MLFPPHLSSDDKYKRLLYIGVLAAAQPIETFAVWPVTGLAGILALILSHLDILRDAVSLCSIQWGIALLVIAMLLGALVKYIGILIRNGIAVTNSLYQHLYSPEGQSALAGIMIPPEQLSAEVAKPFFWPFRQLLERSGRKGLSDPLSAEKRFIKMLCVQSYLFYGMCLLGAIGLLVLSTGIHK